jgi:hypothetical protein
MTSPKNPAEQETRRLHDALAAAVASTQRHAAQILVQLLGLREFHGGDRYPHYDLDHEDAEATYHRIAKELRELSRTAQLWGGQS